MYWARKRIFRILLAVMLCFSITATSGALTTVTVEAAVKAPVVTAKSKTLYVGYKTYNISIKNLVKGATVTYKSSNSSVATVSKKGLVMPKKAGSATMTATVKQNKKTYNLKVSITVMDPYIEITKSTEYMNIGDVFTYEAQAYGTESSIEWSASNLDLVSIGSSGRVAAVKSGSVTINAEAGDVSATVDLDIGTGRLGTFSDTISIYQETTIWINTPDTVDGETLTWETKNRGIVDVKWTDDDWIGNRTAIIIKPLTTSGTDTITVSTNASIDKIVINVNVIPKPTNKTVLSSPDIYSKCGPLTVEIVSDLNNGYYSQGSGFFIKSGMIATAYHVIKGASKITIKTTDGSLVKEYNVSKIIAYDENLDIAILGIDKKTNFLTLNEDTIRNGDTVYAIGSPLGLTSSITQGIVSSASRKETEDGTDFIQFDAAVSSGNSGGPLVNSYGEVIGIIDWQKSDGQNLNFAINVSELRKLGTNRPITVDEYYKQLDADIPVNTDDIIYEDPSVSQYTDTCQTIPLGVPVLGTLKTGETGDVYYFVVDEACSIDGVIAYDSPESAANAIFEIFDSQGNYVNADTLGEVTEEFQVNVGAGGYWVVVFPAYGDTYSGVDITYAFKLTEME